MATGFAIRADLRSVELALATVKNGVPSAATRAINRTLTTVRAEAARDVAADIGVPVRQVAAAMVITKARFTDLRGVITITGRRIRLIDLNATGPEPSRGAGSGVSYALGGGRRRIGSAFIATMRSGHRGVFKRKGRTRLPIQELFGPSIPRVAAKTSILSALKTLGQQTLTRNLGSEIRYLLSGTRVPTGDE